MGTVLVHPENLGIAVFVDTIPEVALFLRMLREATVTAEENLEGSICFVKVVLAERAGDALYRLWFSFENQDWETVYVEARQEGQCTITHLLED